ncbi:precorrin-6A/cobalt-precorrin-6A reductase [Marinomonas atlantica]|uniref:precorrin-6A/cobalt-precorrin-6A reductase n=1 Tax=Marinomonas atlantica TaxID=1806668 RepID=UPI00082C7E64|nr:precorrin-6A/cobalt-precorrin-6A reductase [Marinomonas atlantica]MCO4785429.1 precorrin-6A/cobalt-precorrin-6A reductase [Marinomonas atlantica]
MKILLLGGTADGRHLAERLSQLNHDVLYSIAGLVRVPTLPCEVIIGGFTQFGGLATFLKERQVALVINATHPYAAKMSITAIEAGKQTGVPVWRFLRSSWQPQAGDDWREYTDDAALLEQLNSFKRPLLSAGQMTLSLLQSLMSQNRFEQGVWRTASSPKFDVPTSITWLKAIGPFDVKCERQLLEAYNIDVIVTKNTGGDTTSAKLEAARQLSIPVLLHKRPTVCGAKRSFSDYSKLINAINEITSKSPRKQRTQQQ